MDKQYFITKIKDEYLPQVIKDNILNGKIQKYSYFSIFYIDKKYLRKIKIKNIEETLSQNEQILLDFLLNDNFTHMLTNVEFEEKTKKTSWGSSGVSGVSGTSGWSSGTIFATGYSGT